MVLYWAVLHELYYRMAGKFGGEFNLVFWQFLINLQIKILPKLKFNPLATTLVFLSRFAKLKSKQLQGAIHQIFLLPIFPAIWYMLG